MYVTYNILLSYLLFLLLIDISSHSLGNHPLIIPFSSLMTGQNTLSLRVTLSGGSTTQLSLNVTVNQPTQGVVRNWAIFCDFNNFI